jgi:hypothetical protein
MMPFSLIEAASSSRILPKFLRGLRGLGWSNSIGFSAGRVRGGGERLRAAKQHGKTAPELRRLFGDLLCYKPVPQPSIVHGYERTRFYIGYITQRHCPTARRRRLAPIIPTPVLDRLGCRCI